MPAMDSDLDNLGFDFEGGRSGRMSCRRGHDGTKEYKSKNLETERRRRRKLGDRLLALRAAVPIISNMNRATIIVDAIKYIGSLQKLVKDLSDILNETEAVPVGDNKRPKIDEAEKPKIEEAADVAEEMKKHGIKEDLQVTQIDAKKLWVKMMIQKKKGRLSKLMEAIAILGFDFSDICVTTHNEAILVTSCVEGRCGAMIADKLTRELLLEIINGI